MTEPTKNRPVSRDPATIDDLKEIYRDVKST